MKSLQGGRSRTNKYVRSPSRSSDSSDSEDRGGGRRYGFRKQQGPGGSGKHGAHEPLSTAEERRRARRAGRFGSGRAENLLGGAAGVLDAQHSQMTYR